MVIAALAAAGMGLALPLKDRGVRERWRRLADRLGLAFQPGRLLESDGMQGHLGSYLVRIDNRRRQGTRVSVELSRLAQLRVQPRHLWFFEARTRPEDFVDEADPRVAALLRQVGLARLYLLLLDAGQEELLDRSVYSAHIGISRGEISLTCPERLDHPEVLGTVLGGLARLAECLETPSVLATRLGENARAVSAPVRRKLTCLHVLLENFPQGQEGGRSAWAILQGPSVQTPDGLRLRLLALRHLHASNPRSELVATLDDALSKASPLFRQNAVEALLSIEPASAIERLLIATRDPSLQVSATALRLLPVVAARTAELQSGEAGVEKVLLDLLYRGDIELRVDVICALGALGGPRSIGPLLDLERVADPGVRRICRHALGRLHLRFPERESGSLAIVGAGGELSLPDADRSA